MKKFLLSALVLVLTTLGAHAQTTWGVSAGVVLANMRAVADGESFSFNNKVGITGGVTAHVPVSRQLSFQPSLNFVQKGFKYEEDGTSAKLTANYLDLPLNLVFSSPVQRGGADFFVGAGPSIAFGISGKGTSNDNGQVETSSISFGNDEDNNDLKRFDFGANFLTGIQLRSGLSFAFNYNLGISGLLPGGSTSDGTLKSSYMGFKVGFLLGKH